VFTIDTEVGETPCVLHLKIPNVPTRGPNTVKREVREEQEKNKGALLYAPMDEMRRKQMLVQRLEGCRGQIPVCYLCYN
jgi:hypothetical protein